MDLWMPITFVAAFLQNLRTALQKRASEKASTLAATMTRFLFTFATSHFVFREKTTARGYLGVALVIGGLLVLILE